MTPAAIIERLSLLPHPEGGWFRETWRVEGAEDQRDFATGIYFLLESGHPSHWHRVDADEMWLFHAGSPLRMFGADGPDGETVLPEVTLGADLLAGHTPQHLFPAGRWQAAETTGDYTLVSCIVAPGFDFAGFELAPPGWIPAALR